MHAPDGFLTAGAALTTGALSAGAVGASLRQTRERLADRQVPLAGLAAAFIFAAQMVNFPVAAGTTGHLLGGALAVVLLGPWVGCVVVAVVVMVQALVFADGGLTALGYNVLNMAVVTTFGGWAAFRLARRLVPATPAGVTAAAATAAFVSVVLSSMAFSVEWLFGATVPIPFDRVFGAMVGVHALIAVGEAVITALTVRAVLASRPDLVHGAADLAATTGRRRRGLARFAAGAAVVTIVVAGVVSQFAADDPDGLERVAQDQGFAAAGGEHALADGPFADYATRGVADESVSLALAGISGALLAFLVGGGIAWAARDRGGPGGRRRPTTTG